MGYWIKCIVPAVLLLLLSAKVSAVDARPVLPVSTDSLEACGSAEVLLPYDGTEKALADLLTLRLTLFSQPAEVTGVSNFSGIKWLYRLTGLFASLGNQRIHFPTSYLLAHRGAVFPGRGSADYLYRLGHLLI